MHYHSPDKAKAHVVIFYRDFKDYGEGSCDYDDYDGYEENTGGGYRCHRGLGVNAVQTAKVLRKNGIFCDVAPVSGLEDVRTKLASQIPTHAIFQALWIPSDEMAKLCAEFPDTHFIVRCHSQIGFLQVEPSAIKTLRDLLFQQELLLNLSVSSNTLRLQGFMQDVYKSKVLYLPNLYDLERVKRKRDESFNHRVLRIGSFGAHRLLKNHTTAAAAAMMMAQRHSSDLEFYVNSGRAENEKKDAILLSLQHMLGRVPWAKLVEVPWAEWSEFRQTIANMDLCMQVSFTETFNIVTADAVAEGVPTVVSEAIEWAPESWKADTDNADDIARTGACLLWDTHGAAEGLLALEKYCKDGVSIWLNWLDSNPTL
jgi:hypothetical protein